jgi:hypothetical protein
MSRTPEYLAADLELWADRIADGHIFHTPDELNCAAVMRLAAEALAKQEQGEPVARMNNEKWTEWHCKCGNSYKHLCCVQEQQRTWVGLTDEQLDDIYYCVEGGKNALETWREQARAVEAKLRKKNT